jgi:hypothetical protein
VLSLTSFGRCAVNDLSALGADEWPMRLYAPSASRNRSASIAAMQPVPAAVTACR